MNHQMQITEFIRPSAQHIHLKTCENTYLRRFMFTECSFRFMEFKLRLEEVDYLGANAFDKDKNLPGNLKKAYKILFKSLHPNNKQSISLASSIFDVTMSA